MLGVSYTVAMAAEICCTGDQIYQLKIVLTQISPMIWRRLLVRSATTLAELHYIVQIAMGWEDEHLNRFHIYGKDYGVYHAGGMDFDDDPHTVRLSDFQFRRTDRFQYEYNFYAAWIHDIRVEAIVEVEENRTYPVCIGGKNACPPESARDAWDYQAQLRELKWGCKPKPDIFPSGLFKAKEKIFSVGRNHLIGNGFIE